jgi:hypothetical protein
MAPQNQTNVKQRAVRIPLDYFQRRSVLDRWKGGLALLAALAAVAYALWSAVGQGGPGHFSPGPLAAVHAMWNDRCEACHESFTPTSAEAWSGNPHAADALCQACHRGAEHSSKQIAAEVASCSACHADHRGHDADLIRVADSQCTNCHANIAAHLKTGAKSPEPPLVNVSSFVSDHPDFRSARRDPAQLKFSHSRHMRAGLTFGLNPLKLNDLAPADRQRYRLPAQTDSDLVTLNCASCHELENSQTINQTVVQTARINTASLAASTGPSTFRPSGDYMLPINFETHCQACHQLTIAPHSKPVEAAADNGARYLAASQGETVPHGWSDAQLRRYLTQVLDMRFINNPDRNLQAAPLSAAVNESLEKWRLPSRPPKADELPNTIGQYLNGELEAAMKNLRLQCIECHQMTAQPDSLEVQPVSIRAVWLAGSKFDHAAHRAISCQACHAGAYPATLPAEPAAIQTLDADPSFIPGRQLCLKCHSPAEGSGTTATGGARFDCVECHDYHHGDSPWHGGGDESENPVHDVPVENFINGQPSP